MPLTTSLIASIVSAVIETIAQGAPVDAAQYETYVINRKLPPEAKLGVMLPPKGDGRVIIDGREQPLSSVAQFRSGQNLIVMPMSIQQSTDVVYLPDSFGSVHRVWMIKPDEAAALRNN